MPTRIVGYSESLSESTSTSSSSTSKASTTVSVVSGVTYLAIWSCEVSASDTTTTVEADLAIGGGQRGLTRVRMQDATDYPRQGAIAVHTPGSTGNLTFGVRFRRFDGSGTAAIRNARLIVIRLGDDDESASAVSNQQTTSDSYVDALSLGFTPATSGDYLFLAAGSVGNGLTDIAFLSPAGTTVNLQSDGKNNNSTYIPWIAMWRETVPASPSTAAIRWKRTSGGGTLNLVYSYIVAIRLDRLVGAQTTQDNAADGGTETSYQTTESLAATGLDATARETVAIFAQAVSGNNTSYSAFMEAREAGTALTEGQHEPAGTATRNRINAFLAYPVTSSSSSITFDLRRKSENAALTTTNDFAAIAVLEFHVPITGDASIAEADDSVSATSTLLLQATASITQDDDSVSAVIGITPVLADGAITEADDSVSSAAALLIQGSASIAGDDDSLTGAGALFILATGSALEDDDSVASAAALLIQGGAAIDEGADLISAEGALLIVGAANIVEDDDSVVANDFVPRGRADLYEEDDFLRFHGGISAEWMQEQATKGDIPNWNHCARCHKEMRPNQLLAERRRVGSSVSWTGLYVCSDCLDPIHPQDRQPRVMGGDPRPVPNARPFRGS